MDKYLLEILKEVNTIIIPGLGALTITNADTGEIMFMSYLKHDDGKLAGYIINKEGIDENEAKNQIAKYVRQIQAELDKGESYDMFEFGSFYKKNDEIDFKNWEGSGAKKASASKKIEKPEVKKVDKTEEKPEVKEVTKKEEVRVEEIPVLKKEVEKKVEKEKAQDAKSSVTQETKKAPEAVPEKKITDSKKVADTKASEVKKTEQAKDSKPTEIGSSGERTSDKKKEFNIQQKEELAATTAKMNKLKEKKNATPHKKKRGVVFWMLIGLLVLIVAGGTYVGLNFESVKQHIPFLADKNEKDKAVKKKSPKDEMKEILGQGENEEAEEESDYESDNEISGEVSEEQLLIEEKVEPVVEEKINEKKPVISESNSSNDLPFHIIAGSFSSEANANRFADKFREKGYATSVSFGRGLYLVSIKSYSSRTDAQAGLSEVMADAPKAWVFEKQ